MDGGFEHTLCISVDIQGYGRRDDRQQRDLQRELAALLDAAAGRAGLNRRRWHRQAKGDEELALVPRSEPQARVLDRYLPELAAQLVSRNLVRPAGQRLRLRVAVDHGLVAAATIGLAGRSVVAVSRLLNAAPVKAALADAPAAEVVAVLSAGVYEQFVLGGHTQLPSQLFQQIAVREKEYEATAWLWLLPGPAALVGGAQAAAVRAPAPPDSAAPAASGPYVNGTNNGTIQQGSGNSIYNTGSMTMGVNSAAAVTVAQAVGEFRQAFNASAGELVAEARYLARGQLEEISDEAKAPHTDKATILAKVRELIAAVRTVTSLAEAAETLRRTLEQILH